MKDALPILVVDDSPTQLMLLKDALQERGYRVETAGNGTEAITRVYQAPPGLILSDVMMPELNGYHLCRLLKNDPYTAHIPVILLTNLRERHDRFWGEKAGADLYLEKAADLTPILDRIDDLALPSHPDNLGSLPHPQRPPTSDDIQSRVAGILDRLLYESTISNEILKLTGLAHDSEELAAEFLHFLSVICRYSVAAILIGDGRDKFLLTMQVCHPTDDDTLADLSGQVLAAAGPTVRRTSQVRELLIGDCPGGGAEEKAPASKPLETLHSISLGDRGGFFAHLQLFHDGSVQMTEGIRHALNIVAERFLIVGRYHHKVKEIEQVKNDFVSMLVHDLRAPLTSIRGFTNVLAEGVYGSVNQEQEAALHNIENGCDRLLGLIEDILDLSRLEAGKLQVHPAPLQLAPLVERAIQELRPLFQEKAIEVRIEVGKDLPYVLADGKQLSRVLTNLLNNAAKFTPEGGRVTVSAGSSDHCPARPPEKALLVCISDTGEGIPQDLQKIIFNRFQQVQTQGLFRKGTGLGLAICREIIALHGGDIGVESPLTPQGGSRFSFSLPLAD
jgi:signal transduction histidine kinase/ActR/RegA family two-component response regulator